MLLRAPTKTRLTRNPRQASRDGTVNRRKTVQRSESLLTLDWARTRLRVAKTQEKTGLRRMHDLSCIRLGVTWASHAPCMGRDLG